MFVLLMTEIYEVRKVQIPEWHEVRTKPNENPTTD